MIPAPVMIPEGGRIRVRISVTGRVQGVGFRPFAGRLATQHGLGGWVRNDSLGVQIEAEGEPEAVERFIHDLRRGTPASGPPRIGVEPIARMDQRTFHILESTTDGKPGVEFPPDTAVCAACLREMRDASDRRHQYPFVNCAHCGPRASIIRALPYDRERTTMASFAMCAACRAEYEQPANRRYHAEATACPDCGPHLLWLPGKKGGIAKSAQALRCAAQTLTSGGVIAVKGISGFHLMADANNEEAVQRLRVLKLREAKPFAVMYPDLERLSADAIIGQVEKAVLSAPEAPIVLLERRGGACLAPSVALHNPLLGAMLAHAPLHHLLLEASGRPLIATSANLGEEPVIADERLVLDGFGAALDGILSHDRGIARPADDSVVRVIGGEAVPLRIGRGVAPLCFRIPGHFEVRKELSVLAMGGNEKAAFALAHDGWILLGRHIGDLESIPSREAFQSSLMDFLNLYKCRPDRIACDLHPDYFSSRLARELAGKFGCEVSPVQHHAAHMFSLMLEAETEEPGAAALCFDGTGHGANGTVWGAEWIAPDRTAPVGWRRLATMLPIHLAGGGVCIREPWRVALALAHQAGISMDDLSLRPDSAGWRPDAGMMKGVKTLIAGMRFGIGASSMGRLFDGIASLLGLRHKAQFAAQAAMELEFAAMSASAERHYAFEITVHDGLPALDWRPVVRSIAGDVRRGVAPGEIALAFHHSIARACARLAVELGLQTGLLSGGCFQNKLLAECAGAAMRESGIAVRMHRHVPPNDGGLAAGQALAALACENAGCRRLELNSPHHHGRA